MRFGFHFSISGSIDKAIDRAVNQTCNTMQIFSRNPRGWATKPLTLADTKLFKQKLYETQIHPVFIHTPYLFNLASSNELVYRKSIALLKEELHRAEQLTIPYVVTHLGSHLGCGEQVGSQRIVNAINQALKEIPNNVKLLLENTAGTKNSMGSQFEQIQGLLAQIEWPRRIGVCFDTAHAFAAGYDLQSKQAVEATLTRFDEIIGFNQLHLVHLNDSKGVLNSRIDRHEHIGLGKIGEKGFRNILTSKLAEFPMILETPIDNQRDNDGNLQKVRELTQNS